MSALIEAGVILCATAVGVAYIRIGAWQAQQQPPYVARHLRSNGHS